MKRRQIGVVGQLWRYPVKSLRGESVTASAVTDRGLLGDRALALRDLVQGGLMSARRWPAMLQMRAEYEGEPDSDGGGTVRIELPDGSLVAADDPGTVAAIVKLLGRPMKFERTFSGRLAPEDIRAIISGAAFAPRRDFFDEDVIHLVATGTLKHLRNLRGGKSDFDARRFRANVYVDTGDNDGGFIEDQWLGGILEIGEHVRITGVRPAIRCAMTTHPQYDLPHDAAVLRTAYEHHEAYVGVFASVRETGLIRAGDPVVLAFD